MSERVIHGTEASFRALAGRVVELGQSAGGARWGRIKDADLLTLPVGVEAPLLYFSVADLQHALRRLPRVEVDRAIANRLAQFSPRATDRALTWFFHRERRALAIAAIAAESGPPLPEQALMEVFAASLARMARLSGGLRFGDVNAASMAIFTLEGDSEVLAEAVSTPGAPGTQPGADEERGYIEAAGPRLTQLGRPEFDGAPPFVSVTRGYWITPADPGLIKIFHHTHVPFQRWRGGLVAPWQERDLDEITGRGCIVEQLFPSAGAVLRALEGLTEAQIDRDLDDLLRAVRDAADDLAIEHWNSLRLSQVLLRQNLLSTLRREVPGLAPDVETEVEHETHALRRALARHPAWLSAPLARGSGALTVLHTALAELAADADFFARRYDAVGVIAMRDELAAAAQSIAASQACLRSA